MREILFRGKRTDNGEWVYGYYTNARYYLDKKEMHIIFEQDVEVYPHSEFAGGEEVLPETVCQFTGLHDKNGRKIFEGDIVKYSTNKVGIINYGTACFSVQDTKSRNNPALDIIFADYSNVEVIGNIYDNPELLEGRDEIL